MCTAVHRFVFHTRGQRQDTNTAITASEELRNPNFGIRQQVALDIAGHSTPQIIVQGDGTANQFSISTVKPTISLTTSTTGGSITGGQEVTVGVWALGADLKSTPMTVKSIFIPVGTNTNTVNG